MRSKFVCLYSLTESEIKANVEKRLATMAAKDYALKKPNPNTPSELTAT